MTWTTGRVPDLRRQGLGEAGEAGSRPRTRVLTGESFDDRGSGRRPPNEVKAWVESSSVRVPLLQRTAALALVLRQGLPEYLRDLKLRKAQGTLSHAGVSEVGVERFANKLKVNIRRTSGIIISRRGAGVDKLRDELQKRLKLGT